MIVKNQDELTLLRDGGKRLAAILWKIAAAVRPGMTTFELDELAEGLILAQGGYPVFKGYRVRAEERPFPASICTSINDEVVHTIPSKSKILMTGDILGLDIGMRWPAENQKSKIPGFTRGESRVGKNKNFGEGLITDMAVTVVVGRVAPEVECLIKATREALAIGIQIIRPGIRLGDLGYAIQSHIEESGFNVVRDLAGHGVGRNLHEEPLVPNYGLRGSGRMIKEGMVLAIEPMATAGSPEVILDEDGWTWKTRDGSLAAHFEHTVIVTKTGAEVLTEL